MKIKALFPLVPLVFFSGLIFVSIAFAHSAGSFQSEKNAAILVDNLKEKGYSAYYKTHTAKKGKPSWFVVYYEKNSRDKSAGTELNPQKASETNRAPSWISVAREAEVGGQIAGLIRYAQAGSGGVTDVPAKGTPKERAARQVPKGNEAAPATLQEGIRQYQAENYEEAIEVLKKVRAQEPSSSTAAFFLGMAYKQTNDLPQALTQLRDASTLKPAVKEAVVELIDVLVQQERFDEAAKWIGVAEKNDIYPAKVSFLSGMILMRQGKYDGAIAAFEKAKRVDKSYTQSADVQIGIAYLADRKFGKAKERLQAAITQDPLSDLGAFARRYQDIVEDLSFLQRPLRVTVTALAQYDTNMLQEPFLYSPVTTVQTQSSNNFVNTSDEKSLAMTTTARFDYVPILPGNWLFNANYTALSNVHEKNSTTYDLFANSFSVAPGYNFGRFALNLVGNYTHVMKRGDYDNNGGEYRRYSDNATIGPLLRYLINDSHIVEASAAYAKRNVFKTTVNPELNDMSVSGLDSSLSWIWLFKPGGLLNLKYWHTQDHADGIFFDNKGHRFTATMIYPLMKMLRLQVGGDINLLDYTYENTNFDNNKRRDQIYTGTLGLIWDINRNVSMLAQYTGTRACSNIFIYDYDRSLYSLGFEFKF